MKRTLVQLSNTCRHAINKRAMERTSYQNIKRNDRRDLYNILKLSADTHLSLCRADDASYHSNRNAEERMCGDNSLDKILHHIEKQMWLEKLQNEDLWSLTKTAAMWFLCNREKKKRGMERKQWRETSQSTNTKTDHHLLHSLPIRLKRRKYKKETKRWEAKKQSVIECILRLKTLSFHVWTGMMEARNCNEWTRRPESRAKQKKKKKKKAFIFVFQSPVRAEILRSTVLSLQEEREKFSPMSSEKLPQSSSDEDKEKDTEEEESDDGSVFRIVFDCGCFHGFSFLFRHAWIRRTGSSFWCPCGSCRRWRGWEEERSSCWRSNRSWRWPKDQSKWKESSEGHAKNWHEATARNQANHDQKDEQCLSCFIFFLVSCFIFFLVSCFPVDLFVFSVLLSSSDLLYSGKAYRVQIRCRSRHILCLLWSSTSDRSQSTTKCCSSSTIQNSGWFWRRSWRNAGLYPACCVRRKANLFLSCWLCFRCSLPLLSRFPLLLIFFVDRVVDFLVSLVVLVLGCRVAWVRRLSRPVQVVLDGLTAESDSAEIQMVMDQGNCSRRRHEGAARTQRRYRDCDHGECLTPSLSRLPLPSSFIDFSLLHFLFLAQSRHLSSLVHHSNMFFFSDFFTAVHQSLVSTVDTTFPPRFSYMDWFFVLLLCVCLSCSLSVDRSFFWTLIPTPRSFSLVHNSSSLRVSDSDTSVQFRSRLFFLLCHSSCVPYPIPSRHRVLSSCPPCYPLYFARTWHLFISFLSSVLLSLSWHSGARRRLFARESERERERTNEIILNQDFTLISNVKKKKKKARSNQCHMFNH